AVKTPTLYTHITNSADKDVSHRKIFVYGLAWDTTKETLKAVFKAYGEIEDCTVVMDRVTGKAKGFGFVQFKYRKGASKALKDPKKKIGNRVVNCQLASLGNAGSGSGSGGGGGENNVARKVYVSNVGPEVDSERLRAFFERFGEIEMGPLGFDSKTGKSRGYALFVYRSQDGFRKCLEEPNKMFEGCKLHCQKAANGKITGVGPATANAGPIVPPQMMANFGMFGQGQLGLGLNPMFGGLIVDPNTGLIAANPMYGSGLLGHVGGAPGGLSAYYGGVPAGLNVGVDSGSLLGGYGGAASPMLPGVGLQNVYPEKKEGSSPASGSASGSRSQGAGGSFSGYPSRMR
nr:UBP1-associated protein 2B-like isoform X1 [Tanacetum cinerariifolium]